MADEAQTRASAPDLIEPSDERKTELREAYREGTEAPYQGVHIGTLGEIYWICAEHNWSGEYGYLPEGMARPNLIGADLTKADLRGADLSQANLRQAKLIQATLIEADLRGADLHEAKLSWADLRQAKLIYANLREADLTKANLRGAHLHGANLHEAKLWRADLSEADLSQANLRGAYLDQVDLREAKLREADLSQAKLYSAYLDQAKLREADLSQAKLYGAKLSQADLGGVNLMDADLRGVDLHGADLTRALLNSGTNLDGVKFSEPPALVGVRWNGAPLDAVDWGQVIRLGDEAAIRLAKTRKERLQAYRDAVRAYHGLVVALEAQGLAELARRFRIRERTLQRQRLRSSPRTWFAYGFYSLLNLISGQGEAPERIFAAYAIIISLFTGIYWVVSHQFTTSSQPLQWYEALVLSLSSFHGRGFFPSQIGLGDPLAMIAAVEAVIGLFIELILIATFSNRFLNK